MAARALPVCDALPALRDALESAGTAVLHSPPGTGKTTLVPPVLAGLLPGFPAPVGSTGRVLVVEPRRMTVRAAARRIAWLLGEKAGPRGRVGWTVRGERRTGSRARVEVVTTGILLRRLHHDPELPGVGTVLLDECHERHLDADTAIAFLLDVRAALRPDLRLIAASATTDTTLWARLLEAPVVGVRGVSHPVEEVWCPPPRPVRPARGTSVDPALLGHVADTAVRALRESPGDVLCFLPGTGEINRVAALLADRLGPEVGTGAGRVEIPGVHGRAPSAVQDAVLAGPRDGTRRIVLATSVAESGLTVPGVRAVVDSGLAREPRTDHARGLGSLVTVPVSRASARQRAGRAGREAPGRVHRCWSEAEHTRLREFSRPEIEVADLTGFALGCACWGDPAAEHLALPGPPPAGAMAAARAVLRDLGAVDPDGRVTDRGRRIAAVGLHPRWARALLDAAPLVGARRAAELVAVLSEEPPRAMGDDLAAVCRAARHGTSGGRRDGWAGRWRREADRLHSLLRKDSAPGDPGSPEGAGEQWSDGRAAGLVAALAHPDRVGRHRGPGAFLMVSGTRAATAAESPLRDAPWLAVAVADRPAGAANAVVRLAAVADEEIALLAAGARHSVGEEVRWASASAGTPDVVTRRVERLGSIALREEPLRRPSAEAVRAALMEGLRREGIDTLLEWSRAARGLRERMAFLHDSLGEPWPDVSDEALVARAGEWLGDTRNRAGLARLDTARMLTALLPWADGTAARLEEWAPERVEVPSGARIRVDYSGERPVLAARVQELFGMEHTPALADGRVPLVVHLLSPAGRPAAVTADLASFWREGYRAVRADLRGRYPRHAWPEDPLTAEPSRRGQRRG
ncbi:ATP-dependent helicase HrpB [Streptomyces sp. ST2-7A]|uniref:ATP-dependent helicase HrpB n=1 Tax=Streptomyces sp. ST2-7A TaxID=2907214 RepID=UPI0035AC0093